MKQLTILLSMLLAAYGSIAQPVCTPDTIQTGSFPPPSYNEIDTMYNGFYYEDVLTVHAPDSTFINGTYIQIDSMRVDSISGFPIGIDYECDVPNCLFVPPAAGCLLLYGTPNDTTGVFDVRIHYCIYLPILINPLCMTHPEESSTAGGYAYRLGSSPISSTIDLKDQTIGELSCYPNPMTNNGHFQFLANQNGVATFEIYNTVGAAVFRKEVRTKNKEITIIDFNNNNLPPGVYLYSVELNGQKRMEKFVLSE